MPWPAMPRDRRGAQLSIELPPELLAQLRSRAAAEGRAVSALVRGWIKSGLSAEPQAQPLALAELAARVEALEARLGPAGCPSRPAASRPGPVALAAPAAAPPGALSTPELAAELGMKRDTLNARIRRGGGVEPGAVVEGWRCAGLFTSPSGGAARPYWVPAD